MNLNNFIKGVGIDITKTLRFKKLIGEKYIQNFLNKALHQKEIGELNILKNDDAKARFLASRWSVKEALVKATGNKKIIFSKTLITKNEQGKPFLLFEEEYAKTPEIKDIVDKIHISLSHEDDNVIAIVILENNKI